MSSSENEIEFEPPEMKHKAESTASNLLINSKSKQIYEAAYQHFVTWRAANNGSTSEDTLVAYFEDMGKKYKPNTLWSRYSMLKTYINLEEKIDIGKFSALLGFLKNNARGFPKEKGKVFSPESVNKFLYEAPDDTYLATKVVLIFGLTGACRGEELTHLKVQNIEEHGELLLVKIPGTIDRKPRSFVIRSEYAKIVKRYQALRPQIVSSDRFFLNFQRGKCLNQVIGKNKIGVMPKQIAAYLNLPDPDTYTGHAFRRTSATMHQDTGVHIHDMQPHRKHTENNVAGKHVVESKKNEPEFESIILPGLEMGSDEESIDRCHSPLSKRSKYHDSSSSEEGDNSRGKVYHFENCNVTIINR